MGGFARIGHWGCSGRTSFHKPKVNSQCSYKEPLRKVLTAALTPTEFSGRAPLMGNFPLSAHLFTPPPCHPKSSCMYMRGLNKIHRVQGLVQSPLKLFLWRKSTIHPHLTNPILPVVNVANSQQRQDIMAKMDNSWNPKMSIACRTTSNGVQKPHRYRPSTVALW